MQSIINISNLITLSRIFACIPLIYFLNGMHNHPDNTQFNMSISIIIMIYIIISDFLDGYIARLLGTVTDIGKILDPISDKICFMVVLIYLINKSSVTDDFVNFYLDYNVNPFLLFFILLSLRDIVLISLYSYSIYSHNHVAQSNIEGKIFIVFAVVMFLLSIYDINNIFIIAHHFIYFSTLILMLYSMLVYIYDYYWLNSK